ncbi:MAG: hypothetical protein NT008_08705 [Methylococcales bacterium]|nr:hypothetical protein [Methylococcales bacterium]
MTKFYIDEEADLIAGQDVTLQTAWDLMPEHVRNKITLNRLLLFFPNHIQMIKKLLINNETSHA